MESASPVSLFCQTCHKRTGPVSSTHSNCGGNESSCKCHEEDKLPESQESETHGSPYHSSQEQETIVNDAPMTAEKPAPGEYTGNRMLSPAQEAAVEIRRCSVKFQTLGLDFPSCMIKIAHKNAHEVLKLLKLDDCATRTASIDWKIKGHAKMKEGAVRSCALKALVKYEKTSPQCFNPFGVKEYAPDLDTHDDMDREQIWWLLTKDQRMALLMDEARALQSRKAQCIKLKAEGDWYQSCMQTVRQGASAIKEHLRFSSAKKRKIFDYFQTARNNLVPKKTKAEVNVITNTLLDGIDVGEFAEDSDF